MPCIIHKLILTCSCGACFLILKISKRLSLHIIRFVLRLLRGPKRSRDDCSLWPNLSNALFITAQQLKNSCESPELMRSHVSHVHFAKRQAVKSSKYPLEPRVQDRALCTKLLQSATTAITLWKSMQVKTVL